MAKFNIVWPQFAVCNDNHTKAFENMCRWLFKRVYLQDKYELHTDHNLPGIKVLPVLEPVRKDRKPQKGICILYFSICIRLIVAILAAL